MDQLIALYRPRLNLQNATFSRIEHEDAMVAIVYRVLKPNGTELILKICARPKDYLREVYFLKHLSGTLPVPRIIDVVHPESGVDGAILMGCLPGKLLQKTDLTDTLAHELGSVLARIHLNRVRGYGDLIQPSDLSSDPRVHFTQKFEEGFAECCNNLPKELLKQCQSYFHAQIHLLASIDGPCMIHRDFRPGNVMVYDGKLSGVIDWASGRGGFAEEDFCPLEYGEWRINPENKKAFLSGYASVRPVPDYSAIMPLLCLSRAFGTIGFVVKSGTWDTSHARLYQFNRLFLETFFKKSNQKF